MGITKISKFILKNFADAKEPNKSVNPVEVVARQRILNREVTSDITAMRKMNMKCTLYKEEKSHKEKIEIMTTMIIKRRYEED